MYMEFKNMLEVSQNVLNKICYMQVYTYIHIYIQKHIQTYTHKFILYTYINTHLCAHMHTYTNTHISCGTLYKFYNQKERRKEKKIKLLSRYCVMILCWIY